MFVRSLTIVRDDGPGHSRGVDSPDHPEHAEPAQVFAALLLGQELRVVGENDGDGAADPAHTAEQPRSRWKLRIGFHFLAVPQPTLGEFSSDVTKRE